MRLCSSCNKPFDYASRHCPFCFCEPKRIRGHLAFALELAEKSEGFEANYFAPLAEMEAGSFWFRSRNRLLVWALQRYFPEAENFMEIGCGTGFVLSSIQRALPELVICGSEIFAEGLTFAADRLPGIELFQMDARRIPFREEFDVMGAFDVLEHVKEDEEVLAQIYQATRKGGGILITVPQHPFLWSQTDDAARHVRRYRARDLKAKVERAGFKTLRTTSFVSLLLPLMVIARLKQRSTNREFDATVEHKISGRTHFVLERVMDLERALVRLGVSFPAGGSLLLAARRN